MFPTDAGWSIKDDTESGYRFRPLALIIRLVYQGLQPLITWCKWWSNLMFKAIDKISGTPSILNCVKFVSELHVTHVCVWKCSVEAGDNNVELDTEAGPAGSPQGRSPSIVPHPLITINSYIWKFWHATFIHSNLWTGRMKYLYLTNIRKRTSENGTSILWICNQLNSGIHEQPVPSTDDVHRPFMTQNKIY